MKEIKLLIIDDDPEVLEEFSKSVNRFNRDKEGICTIVAYQKGSLAEANEVLKYYKLDIAIVDLNLKETQEASELDNSDGNRVIEKVIENFQMPIYILTGEPEKLEEKYRQKNNITLCTKGEKTYLELLQEVYEKLSLKTIDYFSRDGYLEKEINNFYWNHLQETLNTWNNVAQENPAEIDKILSRHTVACLNEKLYVNGNIGHFDKYHPGEMYIIPPIKQHYHTGDIISKDGKLFIILNPACDIVNKINLDFYVLVRIIDFSSLPKLQEKIKKEASPDAYFYDKLNKDGKNCYVDCKSNKKDRFHFLAKFHMIEDTLIDFQQIINLPEEEIEQFTRIASISSPFLKDIIARFSLYYARQGQPNLL